MASADPIDAEKKAMKSRMIGVFGSREPELAAIRILDEQWERPFARIDPAIFKDADEREGFARLKAWGWIERGIPLRQFWSRVHGR
jgi:hypothetical protein